MNKLIDWLIRSSADPSKVALTVKGFLLGIVPVAIMGLRVFGFDFLPQDLENAAIDITAFISITLTGFGIVRKLYLTFKK